MALAEENQKTGATQSDLARSIGVHRSVINRELRGQKDITLGRVAELAYALGRKPYFELREPVVQDGANWSYDATVTVATNTYSTSARSIPAGVNMVALDSEAA
jgi:transcriptional regulator with XRE-family HTH domain